MLVTIKTFTFRSFKNGGFFKVKGTYLPAHETVNDPSQPPEEISLQKFTINHKATTDSFATLLAHAENQCPVDVILVSDAKQTAWEKEKNIPPSFAFKFNDELFQKKNE
ncbi:Oidioi.mRNA.OKI2018_I69.PAR.g13069.t1.cds [Oikopleura dioica]|uniref:Oidioi.mRNA.OKI2018_I69.PAR.g13069.t1.cds n=1 Tax=Oikopleura dioica TaxID=34765 RepID=A0ABN7S3M3_OIKDI|nr:Oidioi.mRNA.OKI2018_I69.PAR.g13069.t1.cds [Oikopleura dioica]